MLVAASFVGVAPGVGLILASTVVVLGEVESAMTEFAVSNLPERQDWKTKSETWYALLFRYKKKWWLPPSGQAICETVDTKQ
jgi:hypothetical protein